jgi:hypothetical protein
MSPSVSDTAAPQQATHRIDPKFGLMLGVADQLTPLFIRGAGDAKLARDMGIAAIDAYEPESNADFVNIARTIAFSMAALTLLGQATDLDMPMREKLRVFGRANTLNRSADQSERTMMQRRRYQSALRNAKAVTPSAEKPAPEPDISDADIHAAVARSVAHAMQPVEPVKTPPARLESTPKSASAPPRVATGSPHNRPTPHKDDLLQHTALQRVVDQSMALLPEPMSPRAAEVWARLSSMDAATASAPAG